MIKANNVIMAVLIAAAFPVASYAAGTRDPGVNQRQNNQQQRMQQGARTGDLTRNESRNLQGQARNVRQEERVYKSDGNFSRAERADVHRDLNHLNRDIYSERHDGQQHFDGRRFDDHRFGNNGNQGNGHFDNGRFGNWHPGDGRPGYGNSGHGQFDSRDVNRTQANERERIQRGIRSGELTRSEASRLIDEQRMIAQEERRYRADGILTRDERADLRQDLNAAGQHIYNESHDAQDRN